MRPQLDMLADMKPEGPGLYEDMQANRTTKTGKKYI